MAVLEIAYIVGSIGMQLVNNLANSKQKKQQQERMREYKKAVLEQDMQRAREIQREAAECAKQLEAEAHRIRLEEIESEKDQFLAKWAKQLNIQYWPINVLPFVMMGESFGSMFGGGAKTVAIHCIFTPSNYAKFNQLFYDDIDQGLEEKINTDWSINSDHPVVYYGGCWKERGPYGIPKDIDLPDIDRLEQEIGKLPTLVITPYFDPHLHFRIRHWGMGERTFGKLIPPTDLFSYSYVKDQFPDPKKVDEEAFKKFCDTTVEEIVTFLESLIGFVSDKYFWSFYHRTPLLPRLISEDKKTNLKLKGLIKDSYLNLFDTEVEALPHDELSYKSSNLDLFTKFISSSVSILSPEKVGDKLETLFLKAFNLRSGLTHDITVIDVAKDYASRNKVFLPCDDRFLSEYSSMKECQMQLLIEPQKNDNKQVKFKDMTPNDYSQKRDELLQLISNVLKVEGLTEHEVKSFSAMQKRLVENQFNIVLIGEFQGGKSTTFNALCGGREISPRGAMNKTSAICITATNLAEAEAEEYAEVEWKSNSELYMLMGGLTKYIDTQALELPEGSTAEGGNFVLSKAIDFSNPKHIKGLQEAVGLFEEEFMYDQEGDSGFRDVLRVAKLVIAFSRDKALAEYRKQTVYKIEDVSRLGVFPERWEERWANTKTFEDVNKNFTIDDVLFAFIGNIECYIHSDNLARLGCSVTDCPGLFASNWDTSIALKAMSDSNAVIYLLSGDKEMGQGDERAIQKIIESAGGLEEKVFFAINRRKNDVITKNILDADINKLKNIGVQSPNVMEMNSLLFFLSEFGLLKIHGTMDVFSKEQFVKIARNNGYEGDNIEDLWLDYVETIGAYTRKRELRKVTSMDEESVVLCQEVSQKEFVIGNVERRVVEARAKSILIDNGAKALEKSLKLVDERMKEMESNALKDVKDCEKEYAKATEAYNKFSEKVTEIIEQEFPTSLPEFLAKSAYGEITGNDTIDRITLKLSIEIPKRLTAGVKAKSLLQEVTALLKRKDNTGFFARETAKLRKEIEDLFSPLACTIVQSELSSKITLWQNTMYNGSHKDYKDLVEPHLNNVSYKIKKEWEKIVTENPVLGGFEIDGIDIPVTEIESSLRNAKKDDFIDAITGLSIKKVVDEVTSTTTAIVIGMIVTLVIDLLLTGGIAFAIGLIVSFLEKVRRDVKNADNDDSKTYEELGKNQKKLYNKIRPYIVGAFSKEETKNNIIQALTKCPQHIFTTFIEYCKHLLKDKKNALEEQQIATIKLKKESKEKQIQLARQTEAIRMTQISPLRKHIEAFIRSCAF